MNEENQVDRRTTFKNLLNQCGALIKTGIFYRSIDLGETFTISDLIDSLK